MIKIEVSRRDVAWLLSPLQEFPKECQGAMWQAVKRSLSTARKELTDEIAGLSYLKRSVIRDAVQPVLMYGKKRASHDRRYKVADKDKVFGVIRVSGRKTPLDAYRLVPNAPTRPKGSTGKDWALAGYKLVRPLERFRAARQVGEAPVHAGETWPQAPIPRPLGPYAYLDARLYRPIFCGV